LVAVSVSGLVSVPVLGLASVSVGVQVAALVPGFCFSLVSYLGFRFEF